MQIAILDEKLVAPAKNLKAKCPLCFGNVIAKCGEINIHHWAHKKHEGCDSWSEPETYWHKSWKECFPIKNREVVIEKDGKKHFADIYTDQKIVIELQNSSISSQTIREREDFYGSRLLWVINGSKYRNHISISKTEEMLNLNLEENSRWSSWETFLSNDFINEYLNTKKEFSFNWKYPIRSWSNAKRPVFLDINEDYMLWFIEGIGSSYGKFKVYPKKLFFKKYFGDYDIYKKLNENSSLFNHKKIVKTIDEIVRSFKGEFSTYGYPPSPSLKVYDNFSKKTHLSKIRLKDLIIPNGNNKGLIFIFCYKKDKPEINGVFVGNAFSKSIGKKIMELININSDGNQYLLNNNWCVDYISSIPLNKIDIDILGKSFTQHIIENTEQKLSYNENNVVINYT